MSRNGNFGGIVLILIGVLLLLANLDFIHIRDLVRFWPLLLIAVGVRMVLRDRKPNSGPASGPRPPPT